MKSLRKIFYCAFCFMLILALPSCSQSKGNKNLPKETLVIQKADGSDVYVTAEIARTESQRNTGYMFRKNIPSGTGMLFIFEKDQMLTFWMKNTPHPLSIAYVSSDGVICDLLDMVPYSLAEVPSTRSVRYALEVPQGWFAENGIKKGDKIITASGDSLKKL